LEFHQSGAALVLSRLGISTNRHSRGLVPPADSKVPFDTVIRGLMIALQGKYTAFMQRVEQLAAMPDRGAPRSNHQLREAP
jgi:hypothetical protein